MPNTKNDVFRNYYVQYISTLHVPGGSLEVYKQTAPWNAFKNIVALTDEELGIRNTAAQAVAVRYYDLAGKEIEAPTEGINIVVIEYEGGRTEVKKMTNSIYSEKTDR